MTPQRLDLTFVLAWEASWHVGSGFGSAAVDRQIRRRSGSRVPFVPGAQLKGVLRHQCDRLAATLGCRITSPHTVGPMPEVEILEQFGPLKDSVLLVDRLFGSKYEGECLFVEDLLPATADPAATGVRTRTSIDRLTGCAREMTLFSTEVAEQGGPLLTGRVRGRHAASVLTRDGDGFPLEYGLLVVALLGLEALGGNKSAGLGRCLVTITEILWNGQPLATAKALEGFQEDDWAALLEIVRGERQ